MFAYEVRIILMRFCPTRLAPSLAELGWRGDQGPGCHRIGHLCRVLTRGVRETEVSNGELVTPAHEPESSLGMFMLEVCMYFTTHNLTQTSGSF